MEIYYYEKASKGHISYTERRLGSLYAKTGNGRNFNKAICSYVMAIEDGDAEYSYKMADALTCEFEDDEYHMNKPQKLALNAIYGDIESKIYLSVYYWRKLNNPTRALESLYKWSSLIYEYFRMMYCFKTEQYF